MIEYILDLRDKMQGKPARNPIPHQHAHFGCLVVQYLSILFIFALMTVHAGAESGTGGPASCMMLVTSTQGGTVSPFGATSVPSGSNITFTFTPLPGYEIDHVLVDQVDKGPVPVLTMYQVTHDSTIHVVFGPAGQTSAPTFRSQEPTLPYTVLPTQQPTPYQGYKFPTTAPPQTIQEKSGSSQGVITVEKTGTGLNRIQDAITRASPGDTIRIGPGTYDEQLYITKPLTLTAKEGADKPTISAGRNGSVILITANQVHVNRLTITGGGLDGNELISAVSGAGIQDLYMEACDITDSHNGIFLTGSENITITGCNITNISRNGITFRSDDLVQMRKTTISQCRTDIQGENLTRFSMEKSQINDAADDGALFRGIANSWISGCIISGNSYSRRDDAITPGTGLFIGNGKNVTITENQVVSNLGIAFRLDRPEGVMVTNNTLRNNAVGFSCTGEIRAVNRIEQNTIDGYPVLYYEGTSGKIIDGGTPATLYLVNCSNTTVRNLAMTSRNGYGIFAEDGNNLTIQNVSVGKNLNQNILISGVTGGSVTGTTLHNATGYGLGLQDTKEIRIAANDIRENGVGIAIRGISSGVNLSGNGLTGNKIGFQILDGHSITGFGDFSANRITGGETGIASVQGGAGIIRQNQIRDISEGLNLTGSQGLHIEENQIEAQEAGISISKGLSGSAQVITGSRASFGNRVVRNSITAGNPVALIDSSEWIYGNTFVLNDFNTEEVTSKSTPWSNPGTQDSWGGVSPVLVSDQEKNKKSEPVDTVNTWDTGDRVRYTYGNSTFSGYLGNHWSNYTGIEIGASGVGNNFKIVSPDNIDEYPLIGLQNQYKTGGGGYQLDLQAGWNFISTPSILASGYNSARIFSAVNSTGHSLYSFTNNTWIPIKADDLIQPLHGFWIYSTDTTTVPLIFDPGTVPTPVHLIKGWNVIGFPGIQEATARDALSSLDKAWSYVMGFNATTQKYEVPIFRDSRNSEMMYPSRGYWIHLDQDWDLQPITG